MTELSQERIVMNWGKPLWTEQELADFLGQSLATVQKKRLRGLFPFTRLGGVVMFDKEAILKLAKLESVRSIAELVK
ncbi:helix-turn-helix domain-containing protein [Planctomycetota bacterium]